MDKEPTGAGKEDPRIAQLEKDLERVKKQAAQANEEYMKLTDKYVALESKGSPADKKTD